METVDSETDLVGVGEAAAEEFTYYDGCSLEAFGQQLNLLRRNREFCDVILQVGSHEIPAHRCVLAVASPRLFQLLSNGSSNQTVIDLDHLDLDFETLEPLVEYAYTFRLRARPEEVKMLFRAAAKLQMVHVVQACGSYLIDHMTVQNCIGIRSIINREFTVDLADKTDEFIREHFAEASLSSEFIALPRIQIEMLQKSDLEVSQTNEMQLCQMGVDWIRSCILNDDWNIDTMTENIHLLYLKDEDSTLHDCVDLDEQEKDLNKETVVQDYKILSKSKAAHKNGSKSSRTNSLNRNPGRARQLLFSGNSNGNVFQTSDEFDAKYKVIAVRPTAERSRIALAVVGKRLISLSVVQRVMAKNGNSGGDAGSVSEENGHDAKLLPLADMKTARCAFGAASYGKNIVVAGGYNRGECLSSVEIFDPATNKWSFLNPMSGPRGRFDIAVLGEQIYAVCGSDGTKDLQTAESYDFESNTWRAIASLSSPRSSAAVCALDDRVICIGGWNGQTVMKAVDAYDPAVDQWLPYATLQTGRSQAGIDVLDGRIFVVGGCDLYDRLNSVEAYDPRTESWSFLPPLQTPRRGAGVTQFNGKLYVIGGSDGSQSLCSVEIFDPRLNRWSAGPSLSISRANLEAVELNGKIFAIGGYSGKTFLNSMEVLAADEWSGFM